MKDKKNARLSKLIKETISRYISLEANSFPLITITKTELSDNARKVTIFFTTIPEEKEENALIFMKRQGGKMRDFLKKNSSLKFIPHLDFMIDAGEKHRQHIDKLIQKTKQDTL